MAEPEWTTSQKDRRLTVILGGTAVANMKTDKALIAWATKHGKLARIDRATCWGNPYQIGPDGNRLEVIHKYRRYLLDRPHLLGKVKHLRGKVLACWYHPEACHGDVMVEAMEFAAELSL